MYSSRMHYVCFSGHVWGCLPGVSVGGCLKGVSANGGVCPGEGCLPIEVCLPGGCLPGGVTHLHIVCWDTPPYPAQNE